EVICDAGYDGEYGTIRLFQPEELRRRAVVGLLFEDTPSPPRTPEPTNALVPREPETPLDTTPRKSPNLVADGSALAPPDRVGSAILSALDPDQRAAAEITEGALLIIAGPGTGKTRTLTHRIAHLVADLGVPPEQCLAITFTRRAADEMKDRLLALLGPQ